MLRSSVRGFLILVAALSACAPSGGSDITPEVQQAFAQPPHEYLFAPAELDNAQCVCFFGEESRFSAERYSCEGDASPVSIPSGWSAAVFVDGRQTEIQYFRKEAAPSLVILYEGCQSTARVTVRQTEGGIAIAE